MKSLYDLAVVLIREEASKLSIDCVRDLDTVAARVAYEGNSFLTKTLPEFCKAILSYVELGHVPSRSFLGYKKRRKGSRLPAFLQGWTRHIFDDSGDVLEHVSAEHLRSVRLLTVFLSKVKFDFSREQEARAEAKYVGIETALGDDYAPSKEDVKLYTNLARLIFADLTTGVTSYEDLLKLRYKHGPGAVSLPSLRGSRKYSFDTWGRQLDNVFPMDTYAVCSYRDPRCREADEEEGLSDMGDNLFPVDDRGRDWRRNDLSRPGRRRDESASCCSRITFVPKTCKGPRTIGIESAAYQFVQQGIKSLLYERIESGRVTSGSINFEKQSVNQWYARKSSLDRREATLDLSDASDRVHADLVERMVGANVVLRDAIFACRSRYAKLPSGRLVELKKFASMGSALCFPMESLVFYTLLQVVMHKRMGLTPTLASVEAVKPLIHVYGDDLIVPADAMEDSCALLHSFGLRVNRSKSFGKSYFRESCGAEFYQGKDVGPIYLRTDIFSELREPNQLASFFAFIHLLYDRGNFDTAEWLRRSFLCGDVFPGLPARKRRFPDVPVNSGQLGWPTFDILMPMIVDSDLQVSYRSVPKLVVRKQAAVEGWEALMRFFVEAKSGDVDSRPQTRNILDRIAKATGLNRFRDWRVEPHDRKIMSLQPGRAYTRA